MSAVTGEIVNKLIEAMASRPETFEITGHRLIDTKTGIEYWIANGAGFVGIEEPFSLRFGFWHGWRFLRALHAMKAINAIEATMTAKPISRGTR